MLSYSKDRHFADDEQVQGSGGGAGQMWGGRPGGGVRGGHGLDTCGGG
ncbi:hypothetical protein [Thermogymnomonas acidicola]|nr:hypothetical protein [Thermogymnomonas acidicola]